MFKIILLGILAITVGDRESISVGSRGVVGENVENAVENPSEQVVNDFISAVNLSDDVLRGYGPLVLKVIGVENGKLKYVDDNENGFSYLTVPQTVTIRDFNSIVKVKTSRGIEKEFKNITLDYIKANVPCYMGIVGKIQYLSDKRVIKEVKEVYFLYKVKTNREE